MKTRMKIPDVRAVSLLLLFAGVCSFMCWAIADIIRLEQEISVSNEDVSQLIVKHRLWEKGEKVIFWPKGPRLKHEEGEGRGILREFIQRYVQDASPFSFVLCWPGLVAWSSVPIFNHVEAGMAWDEEDDHQGDDHHWPRSSSRSLSQVRFDAQGDQQTNPRVGNLLGNPSARQGQTGDAFQSETRQVATKSPDVFIPIIPILNSTNLPGNLAWMRAAAESNHKRKMVNIDSEFEGDSRATHLRREKVKRAMASAWKAYKQYAWGFDELDLMNLKGSNNHGGLGVTIIDSLDTLYIMGLHDQFNEAAEWVATSLDLSTVRSVTVSETSARVLGGLLSAYDLSGRRLFLDKAQELADKLLPAWETATGIPMNYIDLASGRASAKARNPYSRTGSSTLASGRASGRTRKPNLHSAEDSNTSASGRAPGKALKPPTASSTLADIASGQIEFFALALRTGLDEYMRKPVADVTRRMLKIFPADGLLPTCISPDSGKPTCSKVTFGEDGGRFYDSLLKLGMLTGEVPVGKVLRDTWEQSMKGLLSLVRKSTVSRYVYIAERLGTDSPTILPKMEEAACFAPGMLALGADDASPELATQYMQTAEKLAITCYDYYRSPGGMSHVRVATANYLLFKDGQNMHVGSKFLNAFGTKTIESYFHLWRKTGHRKYRDWAWSIFETFGYMPHSDSFQSFEKMPSPPFESRNALYMDSSFMANSLKYMYLLYSPPSVMPRDEWVFTTGAHPIKIQDPSAIGEMLSCIHDREFGVNFIWKIENFSKRTQKEHYLSGSFGSEYYSWRMQLYPKGNKVPYLSVYLGIVDSRAASPHLGSIFADFDIVIVDQSHPNWSAKKHASHKFGRGHFGGFGTILSLEDLHNPSFGYLVNDTLIVVVRFLKGCGFGRKCRRADDLTTSDML